MNILLIEDEQPAAERLRRLVLRLLPAAVVVGLVPSVRKGHEWLAQHPLPDLILAPIPPELGQLTQLLAAFQPVPDYRRRFLVHHRDELLVVPAEEIAYFYSEHKTTCLVRPDGTRCALDETLEQVEASLDPRRFFWLNRQLLASLPAIQKLQRHFDGKLWVQLAPPPAADVIVSRLTAPGLKDWLNR